MLDNIQRGNFYICEILCSFYMQDEDIYTFFEPELPHHERDYMTNGRNVDAKGLMELQSLPKVITPKNSIKLNGSTGSCKSTSVGHSKSSSGNLGSIQASAYNNALDVSSQMNGNHEKGGTKKGRPDEPQQEGSSVLDLKGENYFSCAVGHKRSNARYSLPSSEDVVSFLKAIAASYIALSVWNG